MAQAKEFLTFTEEEKIKVLDNLENILLYYGARPGKSNWFCIPGRHAKQDEELTVAVKGNRKVCACHCGVMGDSLKVIAFMEGYNLRYDFPKVLKKGLEILGSNIVNSSSNNYQAAINKVKEIKNHNINYDLTKIITNYFKKMDKNNYDYILIDRGIDNIKLIKKYRILVENPIKVFPKKILPWVRLDDETYNLHAYRYIIPVWHKGKVVNCILRRDDNISNKGKKALNLRHLPTSIFNIGSLEKHTKKHMFFITEGIFDALSFENPEFSGVTGISINSCVMVNKFLEKVKNNVNQLKENEVIFVCCLDSDERGKQWTEKLREGLNDFELKNFALDFSPYKDANEFYIKDTKIFLNKTFQLIDYFKNREKQLL